MIQADFKEERGVAACPPPVLILLYLLKYDAIARTISMMTNATDGLRALGMFEHSGCFLFL
jgi:hypothetical protein